MNMRSNRLNVILLLACFIFILAELNLHPEIYQTVSGKVVDERTGKGIKDVEVIIRGNLCSWHVLTDLDGEFSCCEVEAAELHISFYPPAPYELPDTINPYDTFVLEKGQNLHFIKKIKCGSALKGKIYAKNSDKKLQHIDMALRYYYNYANEINENGEYRIPQLKSGTYTFILQVEGCGPRIIENLEIPECSVRKFDYSFDANAPNKVLGKVICKSSTDKIKEIEVALKSMDLGLSSYTCTNNSGEFEFIDVIPGTYELTVGLELKATQTARGEFKRYTNAIKVVAEKPTYSNIYIDCINADWD